MFRPAGEPRPFHFAAPATSQGAATGLFRVGEPLNDDIMRLPMPPVALCPPTGDGLKLCGKGVNVAKAAAAVPAAAVALVPNV